MTSSTSSYYLLDLASPSASANQAQIVSLLKSQGGDTIQTSSGLCIRTSLDLAGLCSLLTEKGLADGTSPRALAAADAQEMSPDVQAFVGAA